jgi:glutaminyl-peptide cyclotransferase
MSDGTDNCACSNPATFAERRRIAVTAAGAPLRNLNELEFVKGEILANECRPTTSLASTRPAARSSATSTCAGSCRRRARRHRRAERHRVRRGRDRLFVTGKWWPKLFEIKLVKKGG